MGSRDATEKDLQMIFVFNGEIQFIVKTSKTIQSIFYYEAFIDSPRLAIYTSHLFHSILESLIMKAFVKA